MSLGPDSWCLPGDWPRHKLRAYGRIAGVPGGAEYRRLLNFLSKHASQGERELLNVTAVPRFAQVPPIVNRRIRTASGIASNFSNRLKTYTQADIGSSGSWSASEHSVAQAQVYGPPQLIPMPIKELINSSIPQPLNELREPPQFEPPMMPVTFRAIGTDLASGTGLIDFAPDRDVDMTITFDESPAGWDQANGTYIDEAMQTDFSISLNDCDFSVTNLTVTDFLISLEGSQAPSHQPTLHADVPVNIVDRVAEVQNEDGQFLSHLSVLLNEWFNKENFDANEDVEPLSQLDTPEKRRERTYATLRKAAADKLESKRLMERLGEVSSDENPKAATNGKSAQVRKAKSLREPSFIDPSVIDPAERTSRSADRSNSEKSSGFANAGRLHATAETRRRARSRERHEVARQVSSLPNGMRKEESDDGSFVLKDAVGRVTEARSHDGTIMNFSYDNRGHLKSFVRSNLSGKIHTTGVKDKHGVIVRDEHGSLRAQGDSMTVDTSGCVSIRKFDGQFWSLDVLRGIHIERRILEDANGNWNCLTALLTCDGFRMVTRFQKLQESKRESYRKYGDWLGSTKSSKFRFYGRDGSMIEFENDEDLEALRPSRIWAAGTREVDREWVGRRQAGTAWDAVHRYISQYLSAL